MLRAFLKDFDNKMEIQEESNATEASGAPPVAASSDPPSVKTFGEPWATEATEEEPQVTRPASARPQGARRVGSAQSKTRLQGAPAAKRAAPARPVASSPAGRPRSAARPVAQDRPTTARDAGEAEPGSVNWAALRPSSAPPRPVTSSSSFIRGNAGSTRLHESLGFEQVGVLRDVGFKFGRWIKIFKGSGDFAGRTLEQRADYSVKVHNAKYLGELCKFKL